MGTLRINGDTSGYVDITVPAVAGNTTMNIASPTFSGNITVPDTVILNSPSAPTGNRQTRIGNYSDGNFVIARHNDNGSYKNNVLVAWSDGRTGLAAGAGQEGISIDTSGRVKMQYQPYFYARGAESNYTLTNGGEMPFNNAIVNVGGHFNTSTYRFTAPVAGKYLFTVSVFMVTVSGRLVIKVNNSSYNNLQMDVGAAWSQSVILSLNANDYVSVGDWQSMSGGVFYMGHSHFSGILLS